VIWCDEEPPADIYGEALARLIATRGIIYTTFTPLKGMSSIVERLMLSSDGVTAADVNMTIEDAEHIPPEERARIIAAFPAHEREARARGIPILGSGRVFPVPEETIRVEPFAVPSHWALVAAMDFGWDHPFAAVKLAWDRDADCVYVTNTYRVREQTPVVHAAALKPWGRDLKWAWPHDGLQHDKGSGETLAAQYRAQGLNMMRTHATHSTGGYGLEAGIMDMLDRLKTGRLKVFAHLTEWFEEFRLYHRKDGLIVKERDDLLSATRIALMMLRTAASPDDIVAAPHTADGEYDPLG
jgi:Terminase RNaseH-like domain/Terminase large subunit, T4likevirus-type, N-terminal